MKTGKRSWIVLVLLGCFARIAFAQDLSGVTTMSVEPYLEKIRQFPELHNGIRLEGRGTERNYRGADPWSNQSSSFMVKTSGDGSYRHFSLTEEGESFAFKRPLFKRMEGFYDRDYGVLNMMVWGGVDNQREHGQVNGFLKTFGPNHVQMLSPGFAMGISWYDQDSICAYFPADREPTLEPADDGTIVVTSELAGVGKCTVRFGQEGHVAGYTIEKGKEDSFYPLKRVGKSRVGETEYVSTMQVEVSGIEYRDGLVSSCKVTSKNIGDAGTSFTSECEFTFENAGPFVEETDWLPGLSLLKEKKASARSFMVVIYDDPTGAYLPDENGRVRWVGNRSGPGGVPVPKR